VTARRRGLCLFGGSFQPPHRTHERIVRACLAKLPIEKVVVVPAGHHPHKRTREMVPAEVRLELCRLAFAGIAGVEVDDFEVARPVPSFTIDTVRHFRQRWPADAPLFWVIGSDNLPLLPSWRDHHEIQRVATIVTFPRASHPIDVELLAQLDLTNAERATLLANVLDVEPDAVSATAIRTALRDGADADVDALLHPAVARRIRDLGLFGTR
jgi:nicotinate-nucleotide adenylyltransferase